MQGLISHYGELLKLHKRETKESQVLLLMAEGLCQAAATSNFIRNS